MLASAWRGSHVDVGCWPHYMDFRIWLPDLGYRSRANNRETIGFLEGWHRDWTWISTRRHDAPTCSLVEGGRVKGVFLRLNPATVPADLEAIRDREGRRTERTVRDVPTPGATTHFWAMGNNLNRFPELTNLRGADLLRALAARANATTTPGSDGVLASDYIRKVRDFDPDDQITTKLASYL